MNISEMHVWFRQYAQQMGMQNVRAILPEQIDILINTSITDTLNDIIRRNIGISNDRIITDNSKIGQINALKFLYKVKDIPFVREVSNVAIAETYPSNIFNYTTLDITITDDKNKKYSNSFATDQNTINQVVYDWLKSLGYKQINVDFSVGNTYSNINLSFVSNRILNNVLIEGVAIHYGGRTKTTIVSADSFSTTEASNFVFKNKNFYNGLIKYDDSLEDYLFLVDFSIDYSSCDVGFNENSIPHYTDNFKTNLFPLRLIDDSYLADTLNDFILKPRLRSPIMVIYNNQMDIYLGKLSKLGDYYTLENGLVPNVIRMSYIAKPKVVKYSEDINGANEDCDLPEYMHVDILKHAVDLYNISISGNLQAAKQQQDNQNRENVRNNANVYDDDNIRN